MYNNKIILFWILIILSLSACATHQETGTSMEKNNNTWYSYNDSDTVFVFVHGIFSNSKECWTSTNSTYWPELLSNDKRFNKPSIFLGGFYTDTKSGIYRIADASSELFSNLITTDSQGRPAALSKKNIIFIAHSTGGIVVRDLLVNNVDKFKDKNVGLVLLASPSTGSKWADRLTMLINIYGNTMAGELKSYSDYLTMLDQQFSSLEYDKKLPHFVGAEAFENKSIYRFLWWDIRRVVKVEETSRYFGRYRVIPDTDHFSIAKPSSANHDSYKFVWEFYEKQFLPMLLPPKVVAIVGSKEDYSDYSLHALKEQGTSVQYLTTRFLQDDTHRRFTPHEYTVRYGDNLLNSLRMEPAAVVIMHASAFYHKDHADDSVDLFQRTFTSLYDENAYTKFLIFSRIPQINPQPDLCQRWNRQVKFLTQDKFKERLIFYPLKRDESNFKGTAGLNIYELSACWIGSTGSTSCDSLENDIKSLRDDLITYTECSK